MAEVGANTDADALVVGASLLRWPDPTILTFNPFKHVVIDGLWPSSWIAEAHAAMAQVLESDWKFTFLRHAGIFLEIKHSIPFDRVAESLELKRMHAVLSSDDFVKNLGALFAIPRLRFDTKGGGLHRIVAGGLLENHIDFNVAHDKPNADKTPQVLQEWRRLNVLVYLNPVHGGALQLFDKLGNPRVTVEPAENRTVIFECSETSWHGHPTPLIWGPDRLSLAAYYFTREKPDDAASPHDTIFFKLQHPQARAL